MLKPFHIKEDAPRLVILGNSNVGKSSITRYLLRKKQLTVGKIGKHAGSTVTLKLYIDPGVKFQIVDLPGFGAMKRISRELKDKIHDQIVKYVEKDSRNIFLALVVLNCIRIEDELQKWYYNNENTIPLSYEFIIWLNDLKIPSILLLNKIDRIKSRELRSIMQNVNTVLSELGIEIRGKESQTGLLDILPISAKQKINMAELRNLIESRYDYKFLDEKQPE